MEAEQLAVLAFLPLGGPVEGAGPNPAETLLVAPVVGPEGRDGEAAVLSLPRLAELARLPLGADPRQVAFSRDGRFAFVTNRVSDTVSVLDLAALSAPRSFRTTDGPDAILTEPATGRLFVVGSRNGEVAVHDATGGRLASFQTGPNPESAAFWDK